MGLNPFVLLKCCHSCFSSLSKTILLFLSCEASFGVASVMYAKYTGKCRICNLFEFCSIPNFCGRSATCKTTIMRSLNCSFEPLFLPSFLSLPSKNWLINIYTNLNKKFIRSSPGFSKFSLYAQNKTLSSVWHTHVLFELGEKSLYAQMLYLPLHFAESVGREASAAQRFSANNLFNAIIILWKLSSRWRIDVFLFRTTCRGKCKHKQCNLSKFSLFKLPKLIWAK